MYLLGCAFTTAYADCNAARYLSSTFRRCQQSELWYTGRCQWKSRLNGAQRGRPRSDVMGVWAADGEFPDSRRNP